ncbi:hypothetical protein JMJ35_007332 [Cladonia borealis]|uniref:Heterokaryon incompatibility domain-containing protein n=1 Tax=Cladonia borealis TaxID=184061 RepID=A0AA39UZH8_9LECA|nr:hypothetical protein JMJ35_007332 [Cladonia borealis]
MEHLLYNPTPRGFRAEVRAAAIGPLAISDWASYEQHHGMCPPVSPRFPWLGHDHVGSSHYHQHETQFQPMSLAFHELYGPEWDFDEVFRSRDIRRAHTSLEEMDPSEATRRTAAFVQSWLFFGLLESIFARPIPTSYMVRTGSDGEAYLYTRTLPALLEAWARRLTVVEAEYRDVALRKARECAVQARSTLTTILDDLSETEYEAIFSELRKLILSFQCLISLLCEAIARHAEVCLHMEVGSFSAPPSFLTETASYSDLWVRKGWCRFVIASAEITMSPSLLKLVDAAGFASGSTDHELCTAEQCERNNIQAETYAQRHCPRSCRCHPFWKLDITQVRDVLDSGYIPVVRIHADGRSLELGGFHPNNKNKDYIAFSHVWADGLGSNTETGLPACQIRRLHRLAEKRTESGAWFWIDGLCVPKQKPYRAKAIELMYHTYENATGVIVLDEGCRKLSIKNSDLEIGWSIFASGWFGRLWTYQEGFIPPWVDVELSDGLISLYNVIQNLYKLYTDRKANPFPAVFVRDLVAVLQKARPLDLHHRKRPWVRRLVDLFNAMTRRRTSRPDDQISALGLFLELEIKDLLRLEGEDRWKAFYLKLERIPWTVVFDQRPKMQASSFTWAPSTWISSGKDLWLHYDEELADITNEGLKVTLTALILDETSPTNPSGMVIQAGQELYEVSRSNEFMASNFQHFNIVFVRYFKHEQPRGALQRNSSILMRVGLGLRSTTTEVRLQHEFSGGWEIRTLVQFEEILDSTPNILRGRWETLQWCIA